MCLVLLDPRPRSFCFLRCQCSPFCFHASMHVSSAYFICPLLIISTLFCNLIKILSLFLVVFLNNKCVSVVKIVCPCRKIKIYSSFELLHPPFSNRRELKNCFHACAACFGPFGAKFDFNIYPSFPLLSNPFGQCTYVIVSLDA